VKVKFFGFPLTTRGSSLLGGPAAVENGDAIEAAINEWISGQPDIQIVHVQQSATGASGVGTQFLYITVWYQGNAEQSTSFRGANWTGL
jgi:hypothetical protein